MADDVVTEAEQMVDRVALSHWECYVDNEQKLEKLNRVYVSACVGFIVEAAMFALDVMVH